MIFYLILVSCLNLVICYNYRIDPCVNNTIINLVLQEPNHVKFDAEIKKLAKFSPSEQDFKGIKQRLGEEHFVDYKCTQDSLMNLFTYTQDLYYLKQSFENDKKFLESEREKFKRNQKLSTQKPLIQTKFNDNQKYNTHQPLKKEKNTANQKYNQPTMKPNKDSKQDQIVTNRFKTEPPRIIDSKKIEFEIEDSDQKKANLITQKSGNIYDCTNPFYYDQQSGKTVYVEQDLVGVLRKYSSPDYRSCRLGCVIGIDKWKINNKDLTLSQLKLINRGFETSCIESDKLPGVKNNP